MCGGAVHGSRVSWKLSDKSASRSSMMKTKNWALEIAMWR